MKLKLIVLILIWLLTYINIFANNSEYNYLIGKSYVETLPYIAQLHVKIFSLTDSLSQENELKKFRTFAIHEHKISLELEADYLEVFITLRTRMKPALAKNKLVELIDKSNKENFMEILPRLYTNLAGFYKDFFINYETAYEYCLKSLNYADQFGNSFPERSLCLVNLADMLYKFQDYAQCIKLMSEALSLPKTNYPFPGINQAYNTIGQCYQNLGEYDSAEYYFRQLLTEHHPERFYEWEIITKGALGYLYFLQGNPGASIHDLEECIRYGLNYDDTIFAASSSAKLARVYLVLHELDKAKQYALHAEKLAVLKQNDDLWDEVYTVLTKLSMVQHNTAMTLTYLDSSNAVKKRIKAKTDAIHLLHIQQSIHEKNVSELEQARKIKNDQFNLLLGIFILISIIGLSIYLAIIKKTTHKYRSLQNELLKSNDELNRVESEFLRLKLSIDQKNLILQDLEQKLTIRQDNQLMHQLRNMTLLTDSQWDEFQLLFEKAFPGYLGKLKTEMPKLTPNDIRIIALTKLGLLPKQMANMLGVSADAIRVSRFRLMKKMNLSENGLLHHFLE